MARKETLQSLRELHHLEIGSLVSRRLEAAWGTTDETLTTLDVPRHFVTLACRLSRFDEAKRWAELGVRHWLSGLRIREEDGYWPPGPYDDQVGPFAAICALTPVFWNFANPKPPRGDDLRLMRKGLGLCASIVEADMYQIRTFAEYARAKPLHLNAFSDKIFSQLLLPALSIDAAQFVNQGRIWQGELRRLLKTSRSPAAKRRLIDTSFPLQDAVYSALFANRQAAFGKSLEELWRPTEIRIRGLYNFHLQFKLLALWMIAERRWGRPVAVEVQPDMKGFGFLPYWDIKRRP